MTIVEMYVHMDCHGCESNIRKALNKLEAEKNNSWEVTTLYFDGSMESWTWNNPVKFLSSFFNGVHDVQIDLHLQKVTVAGFVDERKVLKAVKKTGKTAQIWQQQPTNLFYNNFDQYQYDQINYGPPSSSNSYYARPPHMTRHYKHGRLFGKTSYEAYQYQPSYSQMVEERPITMFSDDNVNSCSIM